jgi:exopolyphosphatase/guanosine-5'-triphosphate,3'-diphosphate pyrophosphatase
MIGYKYLMKVNDIIHYKGCATSAMREAKNGEEIVRRIEKEAGIRIEIISGNSESGHDIQQSELHRLSDRQRLPVCRCRWW